MSADFLYRSSLHAALGLEPGPFDDLANQLIQLSQPVSGQAINSSPLVDAILGPPLGLGALNNALMPVPPWQSPLAALVAAAVVQDPYPKTTRFPGAEMSLLNGLMSPAPQPKNALAEYIAEEFRRRSSWNDRFADWSRPESTTETQAIERARDMVEAVLARSGWLGQQGARLVEQGSFTNRTNTRNESDIDLRVQHPYVKIDYDAGIDANLAFANMGYGRITVDLRDLAMQMRTHIAAELRGAFGRDAVDSTGKKAIKVRGVERSRSEVDVVPAFHYNRVRSLNALRLDAVLKGVAIYGLDGVWTINYPDQHAANGIAKRARTKHRFKRIVRIVKRLRTDMEERGIYADKVPSFLIECLVYMVEDSHFLVEEDDLYGRVKRILERADQILRQHTLLTAPFEINGQKLLFGAGQAWTQERATEFVSACLIHLGNS